MRYKMQTVSAFFVLLALGSISIVQANGTVKCSPVKHHKPHKHHVHKHVEHNACPIMPEGPCFKSGFYAGLQAGYSLLHGKYKNDYFDTLSITSLDKTLYKSGIVGEILLGGRYLWENHVITGLEVSALVDSNRQTHNFLHPTGLTTPAIVPFTSQFRRKYAIVPSFILGYEFCQRWHAFLKLGASISRFKIKEQNLNDQLTFSQTKQKTTFMPGFGLEYALNSNVSFQGTFSYERFSKINKVFQPILSDPGLSNASYTVKVKRPQYYTIKFGALIKM